MLGCHYYCSNYRQHYLNNPPTSFLSLYCVIELLDKGILILMNIITFGTYDVFHLGHLRILQRARELGDRLIVGVSSDALNCSKKQRYPVYTQAERLEIIANLRCVDAVFIEESLELKAEYIQQHHADILVMGDDWQGKLDHLQSLCKVVYLPRTPAISTTAIIEKIKS